MKRLDLIYLERLIKYIPKSIKQVEVREMK